jgi:transketolase
VSELIKSFKERSTGIRRDIMEMVRGGKRGHIASAFSIVEIIQILYDDILRFDAKRPDDINRDRFILSKGHGCLALYAVLAQKGFFPRSEFQKFCKFDGILGGHPTAEKVPGVETSTGSLGHGLAVGIGMALFAKLEKKDFKVFVLLGDGECDEGSVWESAMGASQHRLDRLVVMVDYNKIQSYGRVKEICDLEPFTDKWKAFGFATTEVDMKKEPLRLKEILKKVPLIKGKPTAVICHTIKGMGVPFMEAEPNWHHKSRIDDPEIDRIVGALDA